MYSKCVTNGGVVYMGGRGVAEGVKVPEFDKIADFGPLLWGHRRP